MGFRSLNITALQKTLRTLRSRTLIHQNHSNHFRIIKRWHVGDPHQDHGHVIGGGDDGVFKLGLSADIALAFGKSITGYLSGSTAIIADAAHSFSDIILSSVAWMSFRAGKAPKDKEHPYGHGKFETLGALGISCMLLVTSGGIAWHAIDVLQGLVTSNPDMIIHMREHSHNDHHGHGGHHHGIDLDYPVLALSMTAVSISVKEGLYWITKRAGEKEGSELMKANAWHHRADAVSSVVALVGVGMILKAGIETGYQSVMELVDAGIPLPILAPIRETIGQVEGVKGCHRLRGRRAGSFLYLDVHIEVDPFLSVSAAHDIGENVRRRIQNSHKQVAEVFIHIDPSFSGCASLEGQRQSSNNFSKKQNAEAIVSDVIASRFAEKMTVEHITWHSLQGRILLEVLVSMPLEMSIREAKDVAEAAEKEILRAAPCTSQVSIQLRLGNPIPQLHLPGNK